MTMQIRRGNLEVILTLHALAGEPDDITEAQEAAILEIPEASIRKEGKKKGGKKVIVLQFKSLDEISRKLGKIEGQLLVILNPVRPIRDRSNEPRPLGDESLRPNKRNR